MWLSGTGAGFWINGFTDIIYVLLFLDIHVQIQRNIVNRRQIANKYFNTLKFECKYQF